MKSKSYAFDEIKSVLIFRRRRFHHEVISSVLAGLFRRKTDLAEKRLVNRQGLFLVRMMGTHASRANCSQVKPAHTFLLKTVI